MNVQQTDTLEQRTYGGMTADQRRAARRHQLIEAGIEVFSGLGYHQATIRAVVRASGLAERYFYESFSSLEELFAAVLDETHSRVREETRAALLGVGDSPSALARAGLLGFATAITRDPRVVRIELVEAVSVAGQVAAQRAAALNDFVEMIIEGAGELGERDPERARVMAIGLVGAAYELMVRWTAGELPLELPELVEHLVDLFDATIDHAFVQPAKTP